MLVSEVYIFKYRLSAEGWTLADGYLLPFIWGWRQHTSKVHWLAIVQRCCSITVMLIIDLVTKTQLFLELQLS